MAYVFKVGKMLSNIADSYLANAVSATAIKDGSLVTLGELAANTTYSNNGKEYDTYVATAPAAVTDEVVICDYAGISEGDITGNTYKLGNKLYNLTVPANVPFRVRRLALHDKFWLGDSNFASTPTVGKYATATASAHTYTPAADLTGHTGFAIKVLLSEDLTAGMASRGTLYLCEVVQL